MVETSQIPAWDTAGSGDIFYRPSGFRVDAVKAVWQKAADGPAPGTKLDWRNGVVVGPWQHGQSRDGVWDMGHILAWHKVADKLRLVEGITRQDVIAEFNNVDNLGVEDPESNRALGSNSLIRNLPRLPLEDEEALLLSRNRDAAPYRHIIEEKERHLDQRIEQLKRDRSGERLIVWDTESTGFSPKRGDKLVDIAAIEYVGGEATGREFHEIVNPLRPIPRIATKIHGIDDRMVRDKPTFPQIARGFLDFIGDAPLVAHNARFDMAFLNAELAAAGLPEVPETRAIDSVKVARRLLPDLGDYNLDALADAVGVDRSARDDRHGALICSKILGGVYQKLSAIAREKGIDLREGTVPEQDSPAEFVTYARQVIRDRAEAERRGDNAGRSA